jgi:hypothetical protein
VPVEEPIRPDGVTFVTELLVALVTVTVIDARPEAFESWHEPLSPLPTGSASAANGAMTVNPASAVSRTSLGRHPFRLSPDPCVTCSPCSRGSGVGKSAVSLPLIQPRIATSIGSLGSPKLPRSPPRITLTLISRAPPKSMEIFFPRSRRISSYGPCLASRPLDAVSAGSSGTIGDGAWDTSGMGSPRGLCGLPYGYAPSGHQRRSGDAHAARICRPCIGADRQDASPHPTEPRARACHRGAGAPPPSNGRVDDSPLASNSRVTDHRRCFVIVRT